VSCTPVHRLSTETFCACRTRPSWMSKSPAQRLRPSIRSRKPHLRPTHYDAQTAGARFAEIPRPPEKRNPRSKA
jgi:hypothetical protein